MRIVGIFKTSPRQVERSGVDPVEAIDGLTDLRPSSVRISELPDIELTLDGPFVVEVPCIAIYSTRVYAL